MVIQGHLLVLNSDEVYEMAKDTAQANQEGKILDEHLTELAAQIGKGMVSIELFNGPDVKKKLGERYDRGMSHAKRVLDYVTTTMEAIKRSSESRGLAK